MAVLTVNYSIDFGQSLRVGYRPRFSSVPFTYPSPFPGYGGSPYIISGIPVDIYEVEVTTICPNCSGAAYSEPVIYPAIAL